jgi:Ohr subfamily peroxiredoxin
MRISERGMVFFCANHETNKILYLKDYHMNPNETSEGKNTTQTGKVLYTAKAHTTGGRDGGASRTSDGRLDVKLSVPGGLGNGTNPEQLFAAGWSACFLSAIKHVAAKKKVRLPVDPAIDAEVDLWAGDNGFSLQARLNVSLPGLERHIAQSLLDDAHQTCPYSKATRGNINVAINLIETETAQTH